MMVYVLVRINKHIVYYSLGNAFCFSSKLLEVNAHQAYSYDDHVIMKVEAKWNPGPKTKYYTVAEFPIFLMLCFFLESYISGINSLNN
jgi:hypothetical protein